MMNTAPVSWQCPGAVFYYAPGKIEKVY